MRHGLNCIGFCALLCVASACSEAGPGTAPTTVRDSAGIRIVEHAADASPPVEWSLDFAQAREYTMPEGEAPLFRASRSLRLDDDRVVVADAGNNRLILFAPDGTLLSTHGQGGDGPGEFRRIGVLAPWIADSLMVWDERARRISVMTPDAVFARSFTLQLPDGLSFARVAGVYPDGSFLGQSFPNMGQQPEAGLVRSPLELHHFAPDGSHIATAGEALGTEVLYTLDGAGQVLGLYAPHFARSGNHVAGEHLLLVPNDDWALTYLSPSGEPQQIVRWMKPLQPVTDADVTASNERFIERLPEPRRPAARVVAGELDIHETMPAFEDVFYDREGRVWLQSFDPDDKDLRDWTVFGPDGALLASVTVPSGAHLSDAGPDWVLVRMMDELGVERLFLVSITEEAISH